MRQSSRDLLANLRGRTSPRSEESLGNIKTALGNVRYVQGNPLTKTEITLNISVRFFDGGNNPLAPAAIPAYLQTSIPFYLFGLTDFYGAYSKSLIINPPLGDWRLSNAIFTPFGIVNRDRIPATFARGDYQSGDMYIIWEGGMIVPDFTICEMRVHCENVAYGTFLNSFVSDLITINTLRYVVPVANINQFMNPLVFGYQSLFGKTFTDNVDPRMYITSKVFQQQIADIPLKLPIDKAVMLTGQFNFDCGDSSMILFVEKVEPLTLHK